MREIKFEIYASLFPEVKKLADELNENMKDFGYEHTNLQIGFKIGEVTVTLPEGKTKQELKTILEYGFQKKVTDQHLWLKEVAYEKEND